MLILLDDLHRDVEDSYKLFRLKRYGVDGRYNKWDSNFLIYTVIG